MPSSVETLHRRFKDRGLAVWAVNIQEPRARVARWVEARGLTVPVLLDESGAATGAFRVTVTPTVVLVDRRGRLVGRALGNRPWTGEAGQALIEALLGDRRP